MWSCMREDLTKKKGKYISHDIKNELSIMSHQVLNKLLVWIRDMFSLISDEYTDCSNKSY